MIGFKVNGEFIDMLPGTSIELEEESPFLQFDDEIRGAFSLPFELSVTEKNARLFNYVHSLHAEKVIKVEAICYDGDVQHSVGYIMIEGIDGDFNSYKGGRVSCYYLVSISYFYQEVKDKKLSSLNWGGDRVFQHGSRMLAQSAFWRHLNEAAAGTVDQFDYTFFPVINDMIMGENTDLFVQGVNNFTRADNEYKFSEVNFYIKGGDDGSLFPNLICPFPYLKYVLVNIFKSVGWTLEGDVLQDAEFKRIVLLSFRDIFYWENRWSASGGWHRQSVSFDLKNFMPDVTVSEFIIAIKNRLGLSFDFDRVSKVCTIRRLLSMVDNSNVDITSFIEKKYKGTFEEVKTYSVEQTGGDDSLPDADRYKGELDGLGGLPVASQETDGHIYFIRTLNAWYACTSDEGVFSWTRFGDNNGNYTVENSSATITTNTSTVSMVEETLVDKRTAAFEVKGVFPKFDQPVYWSYYNEYADSPGICLAFHRGMQTSIDGKSYPYGTNHVLSPTGQTIGEWALTFKYPMNGADYGLYNKFYSQFFDTLDDSEVVTVTAAMPRHVYDGLRFATSVVIDHAKFFIRKKKSTIPYTKKVELELVKA